MYYVNKNLVNLNRIFDQNSRDGYLRLDLNENPTGLPNDFIANVCKSITPELVAKYPEQLEFTKILSDYIGVNIDQICLTNGSAEAIRYVIEAYTKENGKIVSVSPSYAMYDVYSKMYGRQHICLTYEEDLSFNVEKILNAINKDIDLLILLNPNNPVGDVYSEDVLKAIIQKAKECEVTVLIDEAYFYFYEKSFIEYAVNNPYVLVTRTFSKLFSLAGCRLGYVVGQKECISIVQKLCTPHNINFFGMLMAKNIIQHPSLVNSLIDDFREGKNYLLEKLDQYNYEYNAKEGNFLFIKPKTDALQVVQKLKEKKKILIKSYNKVGKLGDCLRVSIGNKSVMSSFIESLLEIDKE